MFYATSSKVGVRLQFCEAPHSNSSVSYPETGSHKKKIALIPMSASHDLRPILMRFFFFSGSIWAFQPIVDILHPQSHGVVCALLGLSSQSSPRCIRR